MVVAVFGTVIVLDVVSLFGPSESIGLYTMAALLLLPYSLLRWGSGREILIGLPFILATLALSLAVDYTGVVDSIVGSLFLLFPATLGRLRPLLVDARGRASWTRSSCSSASSWPASCTTRSPTTSRPSLSARRPAASVSATRPRCGGRRARGDRGGGLSDARGAARPWSAPSARTAARRWPRSRGSPISSGLPMAA